MIEIRLEGNALHLESMRQFVARLKDEVTRQPPIDAARALAEDDPELAEALRESLAESLQADVAVLSVCLEQLQKGAVTCSEERACGLIRAISAIRLKIRETALAELSDETLEEGDFDIDDLAWEQIMPYACFDFLAFLQMSVLAQLSEDLDA